MNLTIEQMREIVDGAPSWAVWFDPKLNDYGDDEWDHVEGFISIDDLIHIPTARLELAKREPMDLRDVDIPHGTIVLDDLRATIADHDRIDTCSDIKNHISSNTKVIEHE